MLPFSGIDVHPIFGPLCARCRIGFSGFVFGHLKYYYGTFNTVASSFARYLVQNAGKSCERYLRGIVKIVHLFYGTCKATSRPARCYTMGPGIFLFFFQFLNKLQYFLKKILKIPGRSTRAHFGQMEQ